jgi:hypothetical protein
LYTMCAICLAHLILLDLITLIIFGEVYNLCMKLLIMQYSPASRQFLLRYKYSPQHPDLRYPQSVFSPWCKRPSFTPILAAIT